MAFDSLFVILCASALLAVCIASWILAAPLRPGARANLRFAAMLLAAIAVAAPLPRIGIVAALLVLPPASAALALASLARFSRKVPAAPASILLAASLAGGLGAVLSGTPMLAAAPAALAAIVITIVALQDLVFLAALSGLALLAALFAFLHQGAGPGMLLFAAVALLGLVRSSARSAFAVEQFSDARLGKIIGGMR
jgi:hypothetical protein